MDTEKIITIIENTSECYKIMRKSFIEKAQKEINDNDLDSANFTLRVASEYEVRIAELEKAINIIKNN